MPSFTKRTRICATPERLWRWHAAPGAFRRLTPPWQKIEMLSMPQELVEGSEVKLRIGRPPFCLRWDARHTFVAAGATFTDEQVRGPFSSWKHRHSFLPAGADSESEAVLEDYVQYRLPFGSLGARLGGRTIRNELHRLFTYRHEITKLDIEGSHFMANDYRALRILITGASGLVGTQLRAYLQTQGHEVFSLTRSPEEDCDIEWSIKDQRLDPARLEGFDAVVHLAGETLIDARWSGSKKEKILRSRADGTRLLCQTLAKLQRKPAVLVSASGINYYPIDGTPCDEDGPKGDSFLSDVCEQWEAPTEIARNAGIRVVNLRISVVLTPEGGALSKMLPVFRMGGGGVVGGGDQHLAWIAIDDLVSLIDFAVVKPEVSGVLNAVAPELLTNREFTHTLAHVLSRPAKVPVPATILKLTLGQLAEETVLADLNVRSSRLEPLGFTFRYPRLEPGLRHMLGKPDDKQ